MSQEDDIAIGRSPGTLGEYLTRVGLRSLLIAATEHELACEIEQSEVQVWRDLLSYAPSTRYTVGTIRDLHSIPDKERCARLDQLLSDARCVLKTPGDAAKEVLEEGAERVAIWLREEDRDRNLVDAILADLVALAGNPDPHASNGRARWPAERGFSELLERVHTWRKVGERKRNHFIEANLRLVVHIAKRYASHGAAFEDLVQEGNLGLIKAVDRFDPHRGCRFSTYATWWIRHRMRMASIKQAQSVRIPMHLVNTQCRIENARGKLETKLGRAPSVAEISEATGDPIKRIESAQMHSPKTMSLDESVGQIEGLLLGEVLEDPNEIDRMPCHDRVLISEVLENMKDLSDQEVDVVCRHFGVLCEREWSLHEIGLKYGLSRERVRQIEKRALERVRRSLEKRKAARANRSGSAASH